MLNALESNNREFIYSFPRCISALTSLAGLLHDLGKATISFQAKLIDNRLIGSDVLRHERLSSALISSLFYALCEQEILQDNYDDKAIFSALSSMSLAQLKTLFQAVSQPEKLQEHYKNNTSSHIDSFDPEYWLNESELNNCVFNAINYLVLTHHKMPLPKSNGTQSQQEKMLELDIVEKGYVNPTKGAEKIAWAKNPPFASEPWLIEFKRQCTLLAEMDFSKVYTNLLAFTDAILYIARPALITADQNVSYEATARAQDEKIKDEGESQCYANSFKDEKQHYAQLLHEHLFQVSQQSDVLVKASLEALISQSDLDLPSLISAPSSITATDATGQFAWQNNFATLFDSLPETGNLILISAETGTGKTRGNAKALSYLRKHQSLRLTTLLGMNTLTKQTATEYINDMAFGDAACAITGHAVTKFEIEEKLALFENANGCENLDVDEYEIDSHAQIQDAKTGLPEALRCYFKPKYDQILATPIVVATIDHLIESVQSEKSTCSRLLMRLQTSDLIIDEIDSYNPSSLIPIYKLVYLAGFYRRNLIVSSATLRPAIANALVENFQKGIDSNNHLFGRTNPLSGAVINNLPNCQFIAKDAAQFTKIIELQSTEISKILAEKTSKRRLGFIDATNANDLFKHAKKLHYAHFITLSEKSEGKNIIFSAGVIRLNNVKYVQAVARRLAQIQDQHIELAVICYHSRIGAPIRYRLEKCLDTILKRKNEQVFEQALMAEPEFNHTFSRAKANQKTQIMLIVVCSPIEETGRDHDFDWGITEPSSHHSLIQLSGRIRRHREANLLEYPNILMLNTCFKEQYEKNRSPYLSQPGAETKNLRLLPDITMKNAFLCTGVNYELGIDARACLINSVFEKHETKMFSELNAIEIQQAHNARDSIRSFIDNSHARLSSAHAVFFPLREKKQGIPVWFDGHDWRVPSMKIDIKNKNLSVECDWQQDQTKYENLWFNQEIDLLLSQLRASKELRSILCHLSSNFMISEKENEKMAKMTFNNAIGLFDEALTLDQGKMFDLI